MTESEQGKQKKGLLPDWDAPALLKAAKTTVVGNGVQYQVARALAETVRGGAMQ